MKPRELENIVKADGWQYTDTKGSHKHYKHPSKQKSYNPISREI
ncbi:type II toxin-antitoxin system HicA family toxin [Desulfosporosinus fructosivorans]